MKSLYLSKRKLEKLPLKQNVGDKVKGAQGP